MWIRSQDKSFLVKCNDVGFREIDNDFVISTYSVQMLKHGMKLGVYSTKEKALKVLDIIQQQIETNETSGYYTVLQMPQDIRRIGNETNNTNSTI